MAFIFYRILQACIIFSHILLACKTKRSVETPVANSSALLPMAVPPPTDPRSEVLIKDVLDIHRQLSALERDLTPSTTINALFGRLVTLSIETIGDAVTNQVLSDPRIKSILPQLHRLCSTAEGYLESHWTRAISGKASSSPEEVQARLEQFPYYSNYVDLTRMELSALSSITTFTPQKFAFIGSGPLPLTSLCILSSQPASSKTSVLNIDIQKSAISESAMLSERLGKSGRGMSFLHAGASDTTDLRDFDVVYLAALVGSTQEEKEELLSTVVGRMREGALLVVRSAERLRRLMYAEFDPTTPKVLECLDILLAVHPYNYVVNSVIIGRVKPRSRKSGDSTVSKL